MTSSVAAGNKAPITGYEWEYARKDLGNTNWQNFKLFLYNPETGEILNRTPKSWGGIFGFYCIFYTILGIFFAIWMHILMSSLDLDQPKLTLEESIIGVNPGLGYRPMPHDPEAGSLIWYKTGDPSGSKYWIDQLNDFLEEYKNSSLLPGNGTNQVLCDYDKPPHLGKVCKVDVESEMKNCTEENLYGFPQGTPCIFIKLNKIFGWKPELYESIDEIPKDMPDEVEDYIRKGVRNNMSHIFENIWVSCSGADPHDVENIGEIEYFPRPGYPAYFYPYTNPEAYLSPVVAVHFKNPKRNTLINVECRAWTKNIKYKKSGQNREGSVHFELLLE